MESNLPWLAALAVTAISVVAGRRIAPHIGLVDKPDERKKHIGDVPLIGGIAIFFAVCSVLFAFGQFTEHLPYLSGALLIVATGVWDDVRRVSPYVRLIIQAVAIGILAFWGDVYLSDLGHLMPDGSLLNLGWLGIPFTIFAGVGLINAFNMTDGLDGLCGSLALAALVGAITVAVLSGAHQVEVQFLLVLSAAIVGFLLFNYPFSDKIQAKVFLGDAGSYLLGFSILYAVMRLSQCQNRAMPPVSALWLCLLPLLDMGGITIRRIIRHRSPFDADREHLHHVFTLAKFSVTSTTTVMALAALLGGLIATSSVIEGVPERTVLLGFAVVATIYLWRIMRAWKLLRFLSRSIDRRVRNLGPGISAQDRRSNVLLKIISNPDADRRTGYDRRTGPDEDQIPVIPAAKTTEGFSAEQQSG